MKRLLSYIVLAFVPIVFFSCVEEFQNGFDEVKVEKIFYATADDDSLMTKTIVYQNPEDGKYQLHWLPVDCIGVSTGNSTIEKFENISTESGKSAVFKGNIANSDTYYAVYPYYEGMTLSSSGITVNIPSEQPYVEHSFATNVCPMAGRSGDDSKMYFNNLCGVLVINLTGTETISSISFVGYDESGTPIKVSGEYTVDLKNEEIPALKTTSKSNAKVSVVCDQPIQLNEAEPTAFYFVLPPAVYNSFQLLATTSDGSIMYKEAKKPLTIRRANITVAGALEYVEAVDLNLSERGNANCYIVNEDGVYSFDATTIGNGEYGLNLQAGFHTETCDITPYFAEILWSSPESGVVDATYDGETGRIKFYASGIEGNALIAAKNEEGTILWSWHIWVTDQPKEQLYKNDSGSFYVLDRSLGATRSDRGEGDEWKEGKGVLYQWGRKDPIVQNLYTLNDTAWEQFSIERAIQNPTLLPFANSNWDYWVTPDNKNLWSSVQKTIYDPCPVGYRVPDVEVWAGFVNAEGILNTSGEYDNGWYFIVNDNASDNLAWYPANDRMIYFGRYYQRIAESDFWYTSSFRTFHVDANNVDFAWFEATHASTFSASNVRCMKDDWYVDTALPILDNPVVEEKNATTSVISFGIKSEGLSEVTESGIVFGTTSGLSIENGTKVAVMGDDYEVELTGLTDGTKYYVRAYAINSYGTSYSKEIPFYTPYAGYEGFLILSEAGTANCYIVPSSGRYMFDASVKGNSNELVGEIADVEVLWETKGTTPAGAEEIIQNVQLLGNFVLFESTGNEGNALVAVKDADGKILWSWHIWVTDTPKEQFYINSTGNYFVQDRNLGAIRADKGTGNEYKDSFGTYYQWGRKDPFIAGLYTTASEKISLETSIAEPTIFPATDFHWLTPEDYELWNSSEKTIYDPCPSGYVISSYDVWDSFINHNVNYVDNGWELTYDDINRTWIPSAAWIDVYGSPMSYNSEVYMWSGTYYKNLYITKWSIKIGNWRLNNGFNVRCMSEKGAGVQLTMEPITDLTKTSAEVCASIQYLDDTNISEIGFVWTDSSVSLDINSNKVEAELGENTFKASITDLTPGATYNVRAFAVEGERVVYSPVVTFATQVAAGGEDVPETDDYEW